MAVPYLFSNVPGGTTIPLAQLDANFAYCTTSPSLISLSLSGALTVGGSATVTGLATLNGGLTLTGPLTIGANTVSPNGITGTNLLVFNTSPTLITPALGTPTQGNLSACTNYPVAQLTGLGTNVLPFLTAPSSATLLAAVTDETGTGSLVFSNNPTLSAPTLNNPILVSAALGTPISGNLLNCTGYPIANLTGTVQVAQGGTGATTAAAALNNLLPVQTLPVAGYVLTTNGAGAVTWTSNGLVSSVDVSGGTTGLTTTGGPITTSGTITLGGILGIANGGTNAATQQAAINNLAGSVTAGRYLRGNGTNILMSAIQAADITAAGTLTNNTTGSAATFTSATQDSQFNSIGVGVAASGTAGQINAVGNITTSTGSFIDPQGQLHPIVLMTSQVASGSSVPFVGIPSWVNKITVMFAGVASSVGSTSPLIQLGTAGGIDTTGYQSLCQRISVTNETSTAGFNLAYAAGGTFRGTWTITRLSGNQWINVSNVAETVVQQIMIAAGDVTLPAQLTQLNCTFVGAGSYTGGVINVMYE